MKRFLWIALIFGGGVGALMVALIALWPSILLFQQRGGRPVDDLKSAVTGVREALAEWNYEKLTCYTDDVPKDLYQKMFDDANGGNPDLRRKLNGVLASMDVFPSVRFTEVKPQRVEVNYEVADGTSMALASTRFAPDNNVGWFMKSMRFPVASTDNLTLSPIVFHEEDNVSLVDVVDKLFDTLMGGSSEEFRSLMMLKDRPAEETTKVFDDIRAQVMACRSDRLRKLVPTVGRLPKGTKWFRVFVLASVDEKRMFVDLDIVPGKDVRIRRFRAGLARDRTEPPPAK
jgi:hypothetical protein